MYFVTFEGIDGSGKSTVLRNVEFGLRELGLRMNGRPANIIMYNDPSSDIPACKLIRDTLLHGKNILTKLEELELYLEARNHLQNDILEKWGDTNTLVLCDRYVHSTYAYQGGGNQIPKETIDAAHTRHNIHLFPDLTLFLDISYKTSQLRLTGKETDNLESRSAEYFSRVINSYHDMIKTSPEMVRIDAESGDAFDISRECLEKIESWVASMPPIR